MGEGPTVALLQQIFEVDPLACPCCYGAMGIVAFITQTSVIDQILIHLRSRASRGARAGAGIPPQRGPAQAETRHAPHTRPQKARRHPSGGAGTVGDHALRSTERRPTSIDVRIPVDLCVTVNTAVAHLAGALGTPTLLRLPSVTSLPVSPDFRWGVSGTRTLWYDSLTIRRQQDVSEWAGVLTAVRHAVQRLHDGIDHA